MRLKSIKLAGFKSFVDPTTVNFPSNMAAVVGPNGCGKSNIIDAVRWVMGESSAKNLRGESMTDVIFNGSVNRQPVGQASIELVFDNSDGGVGGEYAAYSEISVKRLVTREGQSEYYLNGTRCRRRDITDIFLGTGLGPRSYAIIEQGMISRLIESKPEDLRVFIEEAAGISKYKERRKETESRMRRTLENLERLTDLRDELERQLQHLQRQATAAEKYSELKAEEREQKAQLLALQWRDLDASIRQCSHEVGELEVKLEAVQAEHQQVDTSIEQHRVDHSERSDELNKVQGHYYALGSEVARIEQTIKHQQERAKQLAEDLASTSANLTESQSHLEGDRDRLGNWEQELGSLEPGLQTLQQAESSSSEALQSAEQAMNQWQQRWDDFNGHAAEPRQQAEVQQSRIQHLEQVLRRLQERQSKLEQEQGGLTAGPADDDIRQLQQAQETATGQMQTLESARGGLVDDIAEARDASASAAKELDEHRSRLQQLRGRQASFEALQQAALSGGEQVSDWLQRSDLAGRPRLLESLQVADQWQLAVETVLGDDLQAVCVDDIAALSGLLGELEQGALTLVAGGDDASAGNTGFLAAHVSGSGAAAQLLAGVRTADDLPAAMAIRSSLQPGESVITPDGLWLGPDWLRVSRSSSEETGMIARQADLEKLLAEVATAEQKTAVLEQSQQSSREALTELEARREQLQRDLQGSTREHADISARLSAERAKVEQILERRERLARELQEAKDQFASEQSAIGEARTTLAAAIERMEADSQQRETLLSERDGIRTDLDAVRQKARHDKDAAHQAAMRAQSLRTQVQAMRDSIARTENQVAQLRERREGLESTLSENDQPAEQLQADLEQQLALRLKAEGELGEARTQLAEVENKLREAEQARAAIEQRANGVRSELEQKRVSNQGQQVQRDTIEQQMKEAEHDLEQVLETMPETANEAEWRNNLERLANRIARLGPINLAAIDEFTQQSERKTYLDEQNEDLETALATLESAIRKIDKETRNRFRETFDQVNNGLQELFPRVFGGGSAYLELTGEDLLDTGISIMARPPGKKNSTIHLLSGGEKALTAIALVFSIFQLNPAPFCMLDEVDAPLDDANVGRYARMVKEMSDKVQFIFITHNKITMEMADQLLGVTMHEPGCSRLVSVDVDEAAELAAS